MFTGRELDAETGLYYYRARYYDPQIGRFITTNPVGLAELTNIYSYAENAPVLFGDPSGLPDPPPTQLPDVTAAPFAPIPYPSIQEPRAPPQTPVSLGDEAGPRTDGGIPASGGDEPGFLTGLISPRNMDDVTLPVSSCVLIHGA